MMENATTSTDLLLYPALLPDDVLVKILRERSVKVQNLEYLPRSRILEIFNQFCLPHSQRRCKESARGKLLNNIQTRPNHLPTQLSEITTGHILDKLSLDSRPLQQNMQVVARKASYTSTNERKNMSMDIDSDAVKRKHSSDHDQHSECLNQNKKRKPITWP